MANYHGKFTAVIYCVHAWGRNAGDSESFNWAAMNSFMRSIFPREKNLFDTLSEEVLNEGSDNARKQQAYDKQFTQNIRRHALEYLGE